MFLYCTQTYKTYCRCPLLSNLTFVFPPQTSVHSWTGDLWDPGGRTSQVKDFTRTASPPLPLLPHSCPRSLTSLSKDRTGRRESRRTLFISDRCKLPDIIAGPTFIYLSLTCVCVCLRLSECGGCRFNLDNQVREQLLGGSIHRCVSIGVCRVSCMIEPLCLFDLFPP